MSQELFEAIKAGDRERLETLLAADPALARAKDTRGVQAILFAIFAGKGELAARLARDRDDLDVFEAAALGKLDRVKAIVKARAADALGFAADGFTALHYAAHLGHAAIVEALVDAGADVRAVAKGPIDAMPHHSAIAGRQGRIAAWLI